MSRAVGELCAVQSAPSSHRTRPATAGCRPSAPGPHTRRSVPQGPDAAEVTDQAGPAALRPADGDGGTGVRPNQACAGFPAIPAAGPGEGQPGMAAHLHRPQPAQAVPVRPPGPRTRLACQSPDGSTFASAAPCPPGSHNPPPYPAPSKVSR